MVDHLRMPMPVLPSLCWPVVTDSWRTWTLRLEETPTRTDLESTSWTRKWTKNKRHQETTFSWTTPSCDSIGLRPCILGCNSINRRIWRWCRNAEVEARETITEAHIVVLIFLRWFQKCELSCICRHTESSSMTHFERVWPDFRICVKVQDFRVK